jgi:hypothetical protein
MEADLVDPHGLFTIVDPEVGVQVEAALLLALEQQLFSQGSGESRLAQALVTDEAVSVGEAAAGALRSEEGDRPRVAQDALESRAGS